MKTQDRPYRGKRFADIATVIVVALPSLLIGAVCAAAIRLTGPGPVFFRQVRVGWKGRPFRVWKFRTMVDAPDNPILPATDRITAVGRLLRTTSLDELPQLINVARGEMSIVGPRPTLAYQVARYDERQRRRLNVRPGITGLAQVRGRNSITWAHRIDHDLEYLDRQSPALDIKILWWTALTIFSGRGISGHAADDPLAAVQDPTSVHRLGDMSPGRVPPRVASQRTDDGGPLDR
ncbi:MAG TPA: sugar transferase [Candidatus Limnocylindria bacterium]|nr:sugar transferase [Candidatus Limnocylindria bacterium]